MIWHNKEPNRAMMGPPHEEHIARACTQVLMRDTLSPANRQTNPDLINTHKRVNR